MMVRLLDSIARAARSGAGVALLLVLMASSLAAPPRARAQGHEGEQTQDDEHGGSRFSDQPIPLADIPGRPRPLIEIGSHFLGTGVLHQGIRLPTGAVWQPALLVFGTVRTAAQGTSLGGNQLAEAAGRIDLFGNLYLTQTERVLVGVRPLDQDGAFTHYTFHSSTPLLDANGDPVDDFQDELNFGIRTLFFEGDFGEIFPAFDPEDRHGLDIGISVGRQPLSFQNGMLVAEDAIDAVGLTHADLKWGNVANVRVTTLFAWGDVDRPSGTFGNTGDSDALVFGLFTETDTRVRTVEIDAVYVTSNVSPVTGLGGDGVYLGLGSTRRFGRYNNTFRTVASFPVGDETPFNRTGVLILDQIGWTPHHSQNWMYVNLYGGIKEYRSAVRAPSAGGPLARVGLLYGSPGIGSFGNALGNQADDAVGGSIGYQIFFNDTRKQVVIEGGGRYTYDKQGITPGSMMRDAAAAALQYRMAVGRRSVVTLGAFGAYNLESGLPTGTDAFSYGGRIEVLVNM